MARYLLAMLIVAVAGVVLLALDCDRLDEPLYETELGKIKVHTETVYLTKEEGPFSYAAVNFSWQGLSEGDGEGVVVERKVNEDFIVVDTLRTLAAEMYFSDPETLSVEETTYRLLLLRQDRALVLEEFTCVPFAGVNFHLSDTVLGEEGEEGEEGRVILSWDRIEGASEYEARLMTLGTLAPIPKGERVLDAMLGSSDNERISWEIDADKLDKPANYILQVKAGVEDEGYLRSVRGSKLFVLGGSGDEEEEEETD
ncbi:MAG: hypothetical protein U9Q76_03505 [candidate division WOR-3 bacterium]|nr:hypothetical protein [candidate division WOR-3 bacterium]